MSSEFKACWWEVLTSFSVQLCSQFGLHLTISPLVKSQNCFKMFVWFWWKILFLIGLDVNNKNKNKKQVPFNLISRLWVPPTPLQWRHVARISASTSLFSQATIFLKKKEDKLIKSFGGRGVPPLKAESFVTLLCSAFISDQALELFFFFSVKALRLFPKARSNSG